MGYLFLIKPKMTRMFCLLSIVFVVFCREAILRVKEVDMDSNNAAAQGAGIPIILVGNKCDLTDQRKVSHEEAQQKASSWDIDYIETSALQDVNVKQVTHTFCIAIVNQLFGHAVAMVTNVFGI